MRKFSIFILLLFFSYRLISQSIIDSPHNMSYNINTESRSLQLNKVCGYCHPSHGADPIPMSWNKKNKGYSYTLYNSPTFQAIPNQPDGSSILCLSCHDGTIAGLSSMTSKQDSYNLTQDLSNDHPISFVYDMSLCVEDGKLNAPEKRFLDSNGKIQCTSCHDPHNNLNSSFLKESPLYGQICKDCHNVSSTWESSIHMSSNASINISEDNYYASTLIQNSCKNCHLPHDAKAVPLLYSNEENLCFKCHDGTLQNASNIKSLLFSTSKHNVIGYSNIHSENESILSDNIHVECSDCHNSHEMAKTDKSSIAPYVKGANIKVAGVNYNGNTLNNVNYEYEICFRCHSQNAVTPIATSRIYNSNDTRLDFSPNNISFHPVVASRNNSSVPSLLSQYTQSSLIYCTDCHASDGPNAPKGPHGSSYQFMLKKYYNREKSQKITNPITAQFLSSQYSLCAECHNMDQVINSHSSMNNGHVLKYTSCNTCHDPHGFEGGNEENNSFLINFNTDVILPNSNNVSTITMTGFGHGECNLKCHDVNGGINFSDYNHIGKTY